MKQEETDRNERTGMVVATLALAMLLASLGTSIANIALPALATAFSASFGAVQAVVVAYLAGLTVAVVVAGRLGDIHGLKRMLVAGLGLFALASLICGLAPSLPLLIAARAVQGVGAAFLMTLSMALIRETAGEARVGRAMGLLGTMSALGMALGPALGGMLVPVTGWRGVFLVQAPLAGLGLILAVAVLTARAGAKRMAPGTWAAFEGSMVPNLVTNLVVAAVMMTTLVVGPFYLGFGLGLKEMLVGLVMSVGPVISIFSGVPSGRLVDAWGTGRVLAAGLLALAAGAFLLALLPDAIGLAGYVLAIAVLTPGYQLFQSANNVAALAGVPSDRRGTVSGLLGLSRNIGLVAGAAVMGAVFALGAGTEDLAHAAPAAIAAGMRLTFLAAGGLMIAAIAVVGLAGRSSQ
ncbi:MFS transporter [Ciceribacter thiooxidans]|uniref:MFS transporter n=1 Tax=Ciceribacter thiooxidans TaxID=1969821 RepID=A0ABV7I066_9HYPH|nr:MFS transporter [Ciceribacter thiooxidans]